MTLEKIASKLGRKDKEPNTQLASEIIHSNEKGIEESRYSQKKKQLCS